MVIGKRFVGAARDAQIAARLEVGLADAGQRAAARPS